MSNKVKKIILIAPLVVSLILVGELILLAQHQTEIAPWQNLKWADQNIGVKSVDAQTNHQSSLNNIEEKIILQTPAEVQKLAKEGITFELNTWGLTFKDVGKGVWYFYNSNNEAIFRIPKGYAIDAAGLFTNDVSVNVFNQQEGGATKTLAQLIIGDKNWLTSPTRVLPITSQLVLEVIPEKR